jgi:hypothetical protein
VQWRWLSVKLYIYTCIYAVHMSVNVVLMYVADDSSGSEEEETVCLESVEQPATGKSANRQVFRSLSLFQDVFTVIQLIWVLSVALC